MGRARRPHRARRSSSSPPSLTKGRPLSGADGLLAADQLQYFAWIREAAHHVLIGNRFDLAPGDRAFLHPGFAISGGLHALGLSVPLSYLLWKPVAIGAHVLRRAALRPAPHPDRPARRHAALILALFAVMPASWLVAWSDWGGNPRQYTFDFISGEMWSGQYLWGYLMTAIAVFLMPLVLLAHERGRTGWAAAGALLVCWLQPWQGATLALIILGVAAGACAAPRPRPARPRRRRRHRAARRSTTSCSAATTPPGSSRRSPTPPGRCRSGAGRGGRSR